MSALRIFRGILDAVLGAVGLYFSVRFRAAAWVPGLCLALLAWGLYEAGDELRARRAGGEVEAIRAEQAALRATLDREDDQA